MKKFLYLLTTSLIASCTCLNAQIDTEDVSAQSITPKAAEVNGPFFIKGYADFIGKAKFKKCHDDFHHLRYDTAEAEASFIFYYDMCYREGLGLAFAYQWNRLDWNFNPFFSQKDINTLCLILTGFTQRVMDWEWRAQINANFDNIQHWCFQDYMNYDLLIWGRYDWLDNLGLHIGFYAQTGMKIDRVYPIIGVDWQYNRYWKINLVYPVNISAIYSINKDWSLGMATRFFDQRHRVKRNEVVSEALWHYQTAGAEFVVNFTHNKWVTGNVHAGYNFGGHLTLADRHYRHRHRLRLDGAPYAGAEIDINF